MLHLHVNSIVIIFYYYLVINVYSIFLYIRQYIFSAHFYSSACITVKTDMKYPVTPVLLQQTKRALPESLEKRLFTDGAVDGT